MQNFRVETEQPRSAETPASGGQRGHYAIICSQGPGVSLPLDFWCHPYAGHWVLGEGLLLEQEDFEQIHCKGTRSPVACPWLPVAT